jgi:hypothetical protein
LPEKKPEQHANTPGQDVLNEAGDGKEKSKFKEEMMQFLAQGSKKNEGATYAASLTQPQNEAKPAQSSSTVHTVQQSQQS